MMNKLLSVTVLLSLLPFFAQGGETLWDRLPDEEPFCWEESPEGLVLKAGKTALGVFRVPAVSGISHREETERLDEETFRLNCTFTATENLDSTRLEAGFVHLSPSPFWMIPSVSYNGNEWGRGKEPKGARENGEWRTVAARRTSIPGAMYSEGERFASTVCLLPLLRDMLSSAALSQAYLSLSL